MKLITSISNGLFVRDNPHHDHIVDLEIGRTRAAHQEDYDALIIEVDGCEDVMLYVDHVGQIKVETIDINGNSRRLVIGSLKD